MDNHIDARVEFSFRGETYSPSACIDFDELMKEGKARHALHLQLAKTNGIDTYSYLYEAMESCLIEFSNPTGLAADYLSGTEFDFSGFERHWHERHKLSILNSIIEHHFKGDVCAQYPVVIAALHDAFRAGKASVTQEY